MKHRVLVVGGGSIGSRHVRCLLETRRCEVGVCEPRPKVRAELASRHGLVAEYETIDQALDRPWDAAVVATPATHHVRIARRLAEQGIDLLIEKPLAVDEAGIPELADTAESRGVLVAVAYVYRAHPALRSMRAAIESGRFGGPLQVVAVSGQPFAHLRPAYRDIYYAHHDQGGGAIQDGVTHVFNSVEWLVGPITRLAVDAQHLSLEGVSVEDTVHVMARHRESVMASYAVNHHQAPNESTLTVVCEHGTLRLEIKRHLWKWVAEPLGQWIERPTEVREHDDWFRLQEHAFLDCVETRGEPLCSLHEGWQTLRVNRAALRSAREDGAWQRVASPVQPGAPAREPQGVR